MESNSQEQKSTLSTGKYTIELSKGASSVYRFEEDGSKSWICSAPDPQVAMDIIEGLILVEYKRFYHPEATPTINGEQSPFPPFLTSRK